MSDLEPGDMDTVSDPEEEFQVLYDNQETNTDSSSAFERVVKHIMHRQGYTG